MTSQTTERRKRESGKRVVSYEDTPNREADILTDTNFGPRPDRNGARF